MATMKTVSLQIKPKTQCLSNCQLLSTRIRVWSIAPAKAVPHVYAAHCCSILCELVTAAKTPQTNGHHAKSSLEAHLLYSSQWANEQEKVSNDCTRLTGWRK